MSKAFKIEMPQDIYEHYSYGHCMHLAAALHRRLGWEIQVAIMPSERDLPPYLDHAWVVDPTASLCLDSDGLYPIERNGFITLNTHLMKGLSEQDLMDHTLVGCKPFTKDEWNDSVVQALAVADKFFDFRFLAKLSNSRNYDHPTLPSL